MQGLKSVLFGQQKQADSINTTITRMIYNVLVEGGYNVGGDDLASIEKEVLRYVTDVVDGKPALDNDILELVVGPDSVAVLNSAQPMTVVSSPVSAESTKVKFRIVSLGDAVATPEVELGTVAPTAGVSTSAKASSSSPKFSEFSYYEQACILRDELVPLASDAAKAELENEPFALALICAHASWGI